MDPEPLSSLLTTIPLDIILEIVILVFLLACSAFISGAEVALFSLSQVDVDQAKNEHNSKGIAIENLISKPKKLLATILVVNNFINIAIVLVFYNLSTKLLSDIDSQLVKDFIDIVVVTFLILFFGEVLPKIYANRNNVRFSLVIVYPVSFLNKILTPINQPMRAITLYMEAKFGKQKTNLSVDQLSQALELTTTEDSSKEEQKILEGIVSFGNTDVSQVMSPRIDLFAIEIQESFKEVIEKIIEKGYSRIPVYKDNIDQIEGVLYIKDLLPHIEATDFEWQTLLRKPLFVPENKKLDNLLKDFQTMKNHLAIVVDEYGGTSGLVSLEDIIEEIVGDISDEFDDENINYSKIDDHNFMFEGKINLKDFYRIIKVEEDIFEDKKGEAETLAGFLLEILGNFPRKGQKLSFENCLFTIEAVDVRRIKQIKVTIHD
uniref:gliding motility-associated protein GldE n=1 Tax=Flavobacterium sp. TaxID=239 RepID=UPI00404A56A7